MRLPIPEQLTGGAFCTSQARTAGLSAWRIRGDDLHRPFWGIRSSVRPREVYDMAAAFAAGMPAHWFFSHATAAQLWHIPLPLGLDSELPIHVASTTDLRGPTGRGAIGHHLQVDYRDIRVVQRLRVTSLERTVFDLAGILNDEALLVALDNILWRRRAESMRASKRSLSDAFVRFTGRRGRGRLIDLMPLATDRSDAPTETAFRLRFLLAGFPPALPNEPIRDASGYEVAVPDLTIEAFRMVFDYEGDHHRTDKETWRKDLKRVPRMQDLGWHHTRISADDLANPTELLNRTRRILIERGWKPPPP